MRDIGHHIQGLLPQVFRSGGDHAPAEEIQSLLLHNNLEHLHGLISGQLVLWEEEHSYAVLPLASQADSRGFGGLSEEAVGNLKHDSYAVSGFPFCVLSGPVLQILHDVEGLVHCFMGLESLNIGYRSDSTVIVFESGVIQSRIFFLPVHSSASFPV